MLPLCGMACAAFFQVKRLMAPAGRFKGKDTHQPSLQEPPASPLQRTARAPSAQVLTTLVMSYYDFGSAVGVRGAFLRTDQRAGSLLSTI